MAGRKSSGLFVPAAELVRPAETPLGESNRSRRFPRRLVLRWLGWSALLALLAQWTAGLLGGFFRPRKTGTFGSTVAAGSVEEYRVGDVEMIPKGKFYLTRVPEGFLALWWKCPHLGCTIPWKPSDPSEDQIREKGRFNCPCHASIYNRYGQVVDGPAPRPMDRFPLSIRDGQIFVDTGANNAIQRTVADPNDAAPA